jgi:hypothetical protein
MTSKAARRAIRKGRPPSTGKREASGRPARPTAAERAEDAQAVVLTARLRQMTLPDTDDNRAAVRSAMAGCAVGRRIMATVANDRQALWGAVCHIRQAYAAYGRALGSPPRHAQCLRILAPTGALHADAATPAPDLRDDATRARHAVSAYMAVHAAWGYTDKPAQSACIRAVVDEPDGPVTDWQGVASALLCVADMLAGRKMVWRGRK